MRNEDWNPGGSARAGLGAEGAFIRRLGLVLLLAPPGAAGEVTCRFCGQNVRDTNPLTSHAEWVGATLELSSRALNLPAPTEFIGRHYAVWRTANLGCFIWGEGFESGRLACNLASEFGDLSQPIMPWLTQNSKSVSARAYYCVSCSVFYYRDLVVEKGLICNSSNDFILAWNDCFGNMPYSASSNCATSAFYVWGAWPYCRDGRCSDLPPGEGGED